MAYDLIRYVSVDTNGKHYSRKCTIDTSVSPPCVSNAEGVYTNVAMLAEEYIEIDVSLREVNVIDTFTYGNQFLVVNGKRNLPTEDATSEYVKNHTRNTYVFLDDEDTFGGIDGATILVEHGERFSQYSLDTIFSSLTESQLAAALLPEVSDSCIDALDES